jgi:integrase
MASVGNDKNGHRRILFVAADGRRKTVRLGKCSQGYAESVKFRVESLLSSSITGAMSRDTSLWVAFITEKDPDLRGKLEAVGLLEPLQKPEQLSMASQITDFIERVGATRKPGTVAVWRQVERELLRHMPEGIELAEVTKGHCKAFHEALKKRELASLTIVKHVRIAKQIFEDACEWNKIPANPFNGIKLSASIPRNNVEVPRETVLQLMPYLDSTWQAIVALSRFGGLRCPSETLSLKWGDVDFENGRLAIPEPKVEHHEGRGIRSCPLFPELRPVLETLFNEVSERNGRYPGQEDYVIDMPTYRTAANTGTGWKNANLRTHFIKRLRKAGISPWARLFHSMRASRQTELEREYPLHVVCSWLGNSPKVAQRSYLLTTESDFQKAIRGGTESGTVGAKSGTESGTAHRSNNKHGQATEQGKHREKVKSPAFFGAKLADGEGFEPTDAFRRLRFSRPVQ